MANLMYIHGYASTGNATKAQLLRRMFPEYQVISPTIQYETESPDDIQASLRRIIEVNNVRLIVGSSFGGYHALCTTQVFDGPVWGINPVNDVMTTLRIVMPQLGSQFYKERTAGIDGTVAQAQQEKMLRAYEDFDSRVFQQLPRRERQLNFALSRHDEVLGDYSHLLEMFGNVRNVVWSDTSTHHYEDFVELKEMIAQTLEG
ncbi:MAG: hypothetical protein II793_03255 [Bacteroidales bacterium]|nr:hypothetical protein [Bacteroidales bacterium]